MLTIEVSVIINLEKDDGSSPDIIALGRKLREQEDGASDQVKTDLDGLQELAYEAAASAVDGLNVFDDVTVTLSDYHFHTV